jgi:ATP-dependent Clp protease ATP-binding subunit ClpC
MFERFTQLSRRVVVVAQDEARMLGSSHTGTEHLLLGLVHDDSGVTAAILGTAGLTLDAVRAAVREAAGPPGTPPGHLPFSPRAKKVLELSYREALELQQGSIRPEHLLLGLISAGSGTGAQILDRLAGPLPALRQQVAKAARTRSGPDQPGAAPWTWPPDPGQARLPRAPALVTEVRQLLASVDRRLAAIERHLGLPGDTPADAGPDDPSAAAG